MRIGVAIPQAEISSDQRALGVFVRGVEELGYAHLLVFDHVVGALRTSRPGWSGPYDLADPFHEPLVLLSWIAAQTQVVELVTGVLVLPQRQTVLVAKQAAEIDYLSGGRLRLGVGVGWNAVEYDALGIPFGVRGRRIEEQIRLLRRLWIEPHVSFEGEWDRIDRAGLNPRPHQRPIPLWIGGSAEAVVRRALRLADGWMPMLSADEAARRLAVAAQAEASTDPPGIGLEGRLSLRSVPERRWLTELLAWNAVGATHATVNTTGLGLPDVEAHLSLLRDLKVRAEGHLAWEEPGSSPVSGQ